jgi:hypothetical protein
MTCSIGKDLDLILIVQVTCSPSESAFASGDHLQTRGDDSIAYRHAQFWDIVIDGETPAVIALVRVLAR